MTPAVIKTWRERIGVGPDYQLHAATDVERAMVAEIADWSAWAAALQAALHMANTRLAELTATRGVEPTLDRAAALAEAIALLPSIMADTFKRDDCSEEFLNGMAYGAAAYCSAIKRLALAQVQDEAKAAGAAQTCRSSEKVQANVAAAPGAATDAQEGGAR
jgi:hypothetical protein